MNDDVLVAVHPGYANGTIYACDLYGDYSGYLLRLRNAVWSQPSVIFQDHKKIPFDLPDATKILDGSWIGDKMMQEHIGELSSYLKESGATKVELGGEFTWSYEDVSFEKKLNHSLERQLLESLKRDLYGIDSEFPLKKLLPINKPQKVS
jgi:hypothetical protein